MMRKNHDAGMVGQLYLLGEISKSYMQYNLLHKAKN